MMLIKFSPGNELINGKISGQAFQHNTLGKNVLDFLLMVYDCTCSTHTHAFLQIDAEISTTQYIYIFFCSYQKHSTIFISSQTFLRSPTPPSIRSFTRESTPSSRKVSKHCQANSCRLFRTQLAQLDKSLRCLSSLRTKCSALSYSGLRQFCGCAMKEPQPTSLRLTSVTRTQRTNGTVCTRYAPASTTTASGQ